MSKGPKRTLGGPLTFFPSGPVPSGSPGPRRSEDNNPNPWGEAAGEDVEGWRGPRRSRRKVAGRALECFPGTCLDSQTTAPGPPAGVGAELSRGPVRTKSRLPPPPGRPPTEPLIPHPPCRPEHTYVESFLVQKRPPGHSSWSCTARPRLLLIWASCKSDSASSRSA